MEYDIFLFGMLQCGSCAGGRAVERGVLFLLRANKMRVKFEVEEFSAARRQITTRTTTKEQGQTIQYAGDCRCVCSNAVNTLTSRVVKASDSG